MNRVRLLFVCFLLASSVLGVSNAHAGSIKIISINFQQFITRDAALSYCGGSFAGSDYTIAAIGSTYFNVLDPLGYKGFNTCGTSNTSEAAKYVVWKSDSGPTPQETCEADGKYWYYDQCNDVSQNAAAKLECVGNGMYWNGFSCNTNFDACYDRISEGEFWLHQGPFARVVDGLANPADLICREDLTGVSPYDGCEVEHTGSRVNNSEGLWSATYQYTGRPCVSGEQPPNETPAPNLIPLPEVPSVCSLITLYVNSTLNNSDLPDYFGDANSLCDFEKIGLKRTNPINQCHRYEYRGIANSGGSGTPTYDDLVSAATSCDSEETLECTINEYPSDDGTECLTPEYPDSSGLQILTPVVQNPYSVYTPFLLVVPPLGITPVDMSDQKYLSKHLNDFFNEHFLNVVGPTSRSTRLGNQPEECPLESRNGPNGNCTASTQHLSSFTRCSMISRGLVFDKRVTDNQNRELATYKYVENESCRSTSTYVIREYIYDNETGELTNTRSRNHTGVGNISNQQNFGSVTFAFKDFDYDGNIDTGELSTGSASGDGDSSGSSSTGLSGDAGVWKGGSVDAEGTPTFEMSNARLSTIIETSPIIQGLNLTNISLPEVPSTCVDSSITLPWFSHHSNNPMDFTFDDELSFDLPICELITAPDIQPFIFIIMYMFFAGCCLSLIIWLT